MFHWSVVTFANSLDPKALSSKNNRASPSIFRYLPASAAIAADTVVAAGSDVVEVSCASGSEDAEMSSARAVCGLSASLT
jgi:hypothetical protein